MSQPELHPLEISCTVVKAKLDGGDEFFFLDCREADEHQLVNITEAALVPMSEIQDRVTELQPHQDGEIIIHCHHGGRSLQVATWLHGQGFANVKSMAGGIDQWAMEIDTALTRY
ncbi:putative adenylyltransferase/sulfurtransferase MoeZ [Symmachiella macrocystis]|uniref:Putative adenylyltransferase/sulfurtransferase MoeZ n=1 Tax=Symmachiella macrocystis TaxID=2527985 RepID=A0A5C6BH47_9PLAN|nr:rhodanese-like domain-containing protein [Symmachiella macrocystis]TWU11473.1 putative adenylyltransferase/sulfurtransferase MoeZ [Symmachiella macrocystis]